MIIMLGLILVVVVSLIDRLTKAIALIAFTKTVSLIDGVLLFAPTMNTNGFLGLPLQANLSFILAAILCLALLWQAVSSAKPTDQYLILGIVLGVLSNTYDRWHLGYVVDTLSLWPGLSFNLADVLILTGVVGVMVRIVKSSKLKVKNYISS